MRNLGSLRKTQEGRKTYDCWKNILARCTNVEHPSYKRYGQRGITVQESWLSDPLTFHAYVSTLPKFSLDMTLERVDNDGNYCEGNLRWASRAEQAVNRRKMSNNSSGRTGVLWIVNRHPGGYKYTYATARWVVDGTQHSKSFPVSKHGLLPAWALAVAHRQSQIDDLNTAGAGYSAKHGL